MVSILTLPINITTIKTPLLPAERLAVIPKLSPTVLYAEKHSKAMLSKVLSGSNAAIATPQNQ